MASVTKKEGSRYWFACYRLPDGKQKRVSTRTEDKSRARRIAETMESAVREAKSNTLTRTKIQGLINEICLIAGVEGQSIVTVRELVETYWQGQPADDRWQKRRLLMLDELGRCWPRLIDSPAMAIDSQHVALFRKHLLDSGNSATTANMKIDCLGAAFGDAHRRGDLPRNPWDGMRIPNPQHKRQKRKPLVPEQVNALLVKTDGEWRVLIALGYFSGQRQQQCAKVRIKDIDLEKNLLSFPPFKKNPHEHVMPLHPRLRAIIEEYLAEHPELKPDDYLLPKLCDRKSRGSMSISSQFRLKILPKIGITQPYRKQDPDKPAARQIAPYQFHSLRHALATELNRQGVSESVRMALLGHTSKQVHLGYTHSDLESARKALAQV